MIYTGTTWLRSSNIFRRSFQLYVSWIVRIFCSLPSTDHSNDYSNQSTLTPLDLTSTTGDIDMALELSFRPAVSFQIDLVDGYGANANASAYVDVPKLDVQVKQVHNATSSCDPAPASLPAAQVYANLTNIVPSIGFDAFAVAAETELIFLNQHQGYNKSWTIHNFSTACVQYSAAKKTLGPPSKSGSTTSTHASVAGVLLAMIMAVFATM